MGLDKVKVEKFIAAAMRYKGDKYSQPRRMEKGYSDCSSLIYKALRDSGLLDNSKTTRTISTKFMRDGDPRFERIDLKDAKRGDILWYQRPGTNDSNYFGHVAIILDDTRVLEAIKPKVAITSRNRTQYQRAYRIKSLKATPAKNVTSANKKVIENVSILINGKLIKKGYIIDGVTFATINGQDVPVRKLFENIGAKVVWRNNRVEITL